MDERGIQWATAEHLQPNIDGLSFDEVLLISLVPGVLVVLATWNFTRRGAHRPAGSRTVGQG